MLFCLRRRCTKLFEVRFQNILVIVDEFFTKIKICERNFDKSQDISF